MNLIGIDPDKGLCLTVNNKIRYLKTVKGIIELKALIKNISKLTDIDRVYIERPRSLHVYNRSGNNYYQMQKIAVNVGMNRRKAEELFEYCKDLGLDAHYKFPVVGSKKIKAEQFCKLTGYEGRTSEHARDAALLIWR